MSSKIKYFLMIFFSPIILQWCHSSEDVFDYIFGNDDDDIFATPKPAQPTKTANAPVKDAVEVPVQEPVKDSVEEPKKEAVQEPAKKLISDIVKEPAKENSNGNLGFVPLKEFLKMGVPVQELAEAPTIKLDTEDGQDMPLGQYLKVGETPSKKKKNKKKRRRRSARYIMRQVDKLGNKGAPQALMAFSFVLATLSRGVKGLKSVVDGSTNMSSKTVETVSNANNSTIDTMQGMLNGTANAAMKQVNSWVDTLDLLRRSMSGSVKKKVDKGHSITITTSSDAPVKTLASFVDKWGNGGALTGNGQKGGNKSNSVLPGMPPVLPEVTSVDFSNFWK